MIHNLENYKNAKSTDDIYSLGLNFVEEIPDEMPKFVDDPFEMLKKQLNNGEISPSDALSIYEQRNFELSHQNMVKEFRLKELYNDHGMYGFVSWKWLNPFIEWIGDRKCLEVMAGRGWLSKGLREKGIDVIATDDYSWFSVKGWKEPLTEVEQLDAVAAVEKYGSEVDLVIMSWPYMDNTAFKVLKKLYEVNPNAYIVYIGEYEGGCTADYKFFEHFTYDESDLTFYSKVAPHYQSWHAIHDRLLLGRYKEEI